MAIGSDTSESQRNEDERIVNDNNNEETETQDEHGFSAETIVPDGTEPSQPATSNNNENSQDDEVTVQQDQSNSQEDYEAETQRSELVVPDTPVKKRQRIDPESPASTYWSVVQGTPDRANQQRVDDGSLSPLSRIDDEEEEEEEENNQGQTHPDAEEEEREAPTDEQAVIWGTDVHVPTAGKAFTNFLRHYTLKSTNNDNSNDSDSETSSSNEPYYLSQLHQIIRGETAETNSIDINCLHLFHHNAACQLVYQQLISYPQEMIPLFDLITNREYQKLFNDTETRLQVRPHHLKHLSHMRKLDPHNIDTLIALRGMIVRTSPIIPDLKVGFFVCSICGSTKKVTIDRGRIAHPSKCPDCQSKQSFTLVHNRSTFADKQMVRLQETPDEVPAGETPCSILLLVYDSLVDSVRPGDRVEVTGVFRAQPRRIHPRITKVNSVYKTYLDVIHFRKINQSQGSRIQLQSKSLTTARIAELEEIGSDSKIYDRLVSSLAPSIWEMEDVKKGVLCMLFGGNSRVSHTQDDEEEDEEENEEMLYKRGEINILLCGDPGTSKSQLLSYVHKLSPRGVYTSGKGSSAVGLTASIIRDPDSRDLVLESGALVLSDHGICCIDEFDKMNVTTRAILHEAMEQQTVSIAKAGIIATLNARTAILASANPLESRYNPKLSVVENIKLPPTLLSRFDLIYLILDNVEAEKDRRLAKHLVSLYQPREEAELRRQSASTITPLDHDTLRDYIAYARKYIHPTISDLANQEFLKSYLAMRQAGASTHTISATPRQLESLIRISEALAKMRLSRVVERRDVLEAVRLMKVATQAAATDPRTGKIDMDMITTGRTALDRQLQEQMYILLKEILSTKKGQKVVVSELMEEVRQSLSSSDVVTEDLMEQLKVLENDGLLQFVERGLMVYVRTGIVM